MPSKLNIWLLQIAEPLPFEPGVRKMRTGLLAQELSRRGHSVTWWTSAFDHTKKAWAAQDGETKKLMPGVTVRFIKGCGYAGNLSPKRFLDHRLVASKFAKRARLLPPPDIIVASMPSYDLSYQAVNLATKHAIPFILDLRDQWPDIFLRHLPAPLLPLARLVLAYDNYMLRAQCRSADSLVSMMDGLLDWGLEKAGRKRSQDDKVFLIGAPRPPKRDWPDTFGIAQSKFVVAFVGTFGTHSSPLALLNSARRLQAHKEILFVMGGSGDNFEALKRQAAGLDNVLFTGWLDTEQIYALLSRAHAGAVCGSSGHEAFPNKAFVYCSMGLPLICNMEGGLKDVVEKEDIGLYCPSGDAAKLDECILRLKNEPGLRQRLAENSQRVFLETMDSEKIYSAYADHVERMAAKRGRREG